MDGFEFNKIFGWALAAILVIVGGRTYMEIANEGHGGGHAEKTAYVIEVEDDSAAKPADEKKEVVTVVDIKTLLASANVDRGAKQAKKCKACHSFDKGGKNKVGPALYDIVNRKKASASGFSYSSSMKEKGGVWNYEDLAAFLKSPKKFVPGTAMAFGGIRDSTKAADLIAFLRGNSDKPASLD